MKNKNKNKQTGFTLIELMITISIAGIMLAVATPSLRTMLLKNKTVAYTEDFKMALYHAQNEAVKRNVRVAIKPNHANAELWSEGWEMFQDTNSDGSRQNTEELISSYTPSAINYQLKSKTANYATYLSFNALGEPTAASSSSAEFRICPPNNEAIFSRIINVSFSGNVTVSAGDNSTCP